MNMNDTMEKQNHSKKKPSHKRYIIAAACFFLITAGLVLFVFTQKQKPDPASEKVIREAATYWLMDGKSPYKIPNDLTD